MTCIAALVHEGTVWMGGDSAGVAESLEIVDCVETKVWNNNGVLFGAFGSFRVAQVLRFQMTVPPFDPDDDLLKYVVTDLVDAMRNALETNGALNIWIDDSTIEMSGSGLLVALGGRIFDILGDFGIGEYRDGYAAVGCGGPFAYGSLYSTEGVKPRKRILTALEASARFSAGVRAPFIIEKL